MFRMMRKPRNGQSSMEYIFLVLIAISAFLGIQNYFKRGLAGRWKAAIDDVGDQYDPRLTNSSIVHRLEVNSVTIITTVNAVNGFWTLRSDDANSLETKTGFMTVGSQ